jgi:anaerobic selenocysteine-containing dehydrogenase
VQRGRRAIPPLVVSKPDWEGFSRLAKQLGGEGLE